MAVQNFNILKVLNVQDILEEVGIVDPEFISRLNLATPSVTPDGETSQGLGPRGKRWGVQLS